MDRALWIVLSFFNHQSQVIQFTEHLIGCRVCSSHKDRQWHQTLYFKHSFFLPKISGLAREIRFIETFASRRVVRAIVPWACLCHLPKPLQMFHVSQLILTLFLLLDIFPRPPTHTLRHKAHHEGSAMSCFLCWETPENQYQSINQSLLQNTRMSCP